jgi:hypothetical protein
MTLTVPPNALTKAIPFSIQPITNKTEGGLGPAYRLGPDGMTFATPLQLSIRFDDHDLEGTFAEALSLAYQDGKGAWHGQKIVKLDQAGKTLTISTTHFTDEAMMPGIRISPTKATVYVGGKDLFISLTIFQCTDPGFWDRLLSRPRDCTPTNIQVNRDWTLDGPGKIQFATMPARPNSLNDPINGQMYTPPASKPTPNVAYVKVTTSAQIWNPATGEMFAGPRTFQTQITILDRGYRATGSTGGVALSGVICDLEKPFTIIGTADIAYTYNFNPSSATGGTGSYSLPQYLLGATGGYTVEGADTDHPTIVWQTVTTAGIGTPVARSRNVGYEIPLVPLEGDECGSN